MVLHVFGSTLGKGCNTPSLVMRKALIASVSSLALLGLIGGCLIFAQGGFTSSSKRGEWSVFVPPPQAYVMAAIMFALSTIAVVWLLREVNARRSLYLLAGVVYFGLAAILTQVLAAYL